jgi:nucleotide-binding universal stress UspA family protein
MAGNEVESERIVVGVDGSPSSKEALQWAVRQADFTGAVLEAVTVWEYPEGVGWDARYSEGFNPEADARRTLDAAVEEATKDFPSIEVSLKVIEGHPAPILVEASKNASILVLGSKGHGEFVGMLVGSVSEFCVTHAHCPVLVFRR